MNPKIFTSFLSVNDFLLAQKVKCRIIKTVQSISKYKIKNINLTQFNFFGEIKSLTSTFEECFEENIQNIKIQATKCGANCVSGITIKTDWDDFKTLKISILGNAGYIEELNHYDSKSIFLSSLNLEQTYKLISNNIIPKDILYSFSYFVINDKDYQNTLLGNLEYRVLSDNFRLIRTKSLNHINNLAKKNSLDGVIGLDMKFLTDINLDQKDLGPDKYCFTINAIFIHQIIATGIVNSNTKINLKSNLVINLIGQTQPSLNIV